MALPHESGLTSRSAVVGDGSIPRTTSHDRPRRSLDQAAGPPGKRTASSASRTAQQTRERDGADDVKTRRAEEKSRDKGGESDKGDSGGDGDEDPMADLARLAKHRGPPDDGGDSAQRQRKSVQQYDREDENGGHPYPPKVKSYTGTDPFRLLGLRIPQSTIAALKQKRSGSISSPESPPMQDLPRFDQGTGTGTGGYSFGKRQAFLGFFSRIGTAQGRKKARIGEFYEGQNELIESLLRPVGSAREDAQRQREENEAERRRWQVKIAVNGSLLVNIILFTLQLSAAIVAKSLSLYATTADSFMDLLSSLILAAANRMKVRANWAKYPTGKGRIETTAIITFASLMGTVSIQLIIESIRTFVSSDHSVPDITLLPILFVSLALASKGCLFVYCYLLRAYPSARVLAQDHRNDLVVNSFGLMTSLLGGHIGWFFDPLGAMLIALFILFSWSRTAWEHIQLIIGKTADPGFLQRVTYIAVTHSNKILKVDTCRAYHQGEKLYVEVDIVMDRLTPLWETHDCGEELQIKLESLVEVERAFVHVDYETSHAPEHRKTQ